MLLGSIKEKNTEETRVSLVPSIVEKLTKQHTILLPKNYGVKADFQDKEYLKAGATFLNNEDEIYQKSEIIFQILPPSTQKLSLLTNKQTIIADFRNLDTSYIPDRKSVV